MMKKVCGSFFQSSGHQDEESLKDFDDYCAVADWYIHTKDLNMALWYRDDELLSPKPGPVRSFFRRIFGYESKERIH